MERTQKIWIYLHDIIEDYDLKPAKRKVIFGLFEYRPRARKYGGVFLRFDMPDNTTILISQN